jgi:hypothetical protein
LWGCSYKVCYVNIASGNFFWRVFLFLRVGCGSLDFAFYLKNQINIKKQNPMCRMCAGTKSMTEKITEGLDVGKGKKDRGRFNKYL